MILDTVSLEGRTGHVYHILPGSEVITRCRGITHIAEMVAARPDFFLYLERRESQSYVTGGDYRMMRDAAMARDYAQASKRFEGVINLHCAIVGVPSPVIRWHADAYHFALTVSMERHCNRSTVHIAKRLVDRATTSIGESYGQQIQPSAEVRRNAAARYRV